MTLEEVRVALKEVWDVQKWLLVGIGEHCRRTREKVVYCHDFEVRVGSRGSRWFA